MGWALCSGCCARCGAVFSFNPNKVPSIRIHGNREPICRPCVETANPQRIANGLAPIAIAADAYEPCAESEL